MVNLPHPVKQLDVVVRTRLANDFGGMKPHFTESSGVRLNVGLNRKASHNFGQLFRESAFRRFIVHGVVVAAVAHDGVGGDNSNSNTIIILIIFINDNGILETCPCRS